MYSDGITPEDAWSNTVYNGGFGGVGPNAGLVLTKYINATAGQIHAFSASLTPQQGLVLTETDVLNGNSTLTVSPFSITFNDATVQTTAGISPATAASTYAALASANSFTTTQSIAANSASAALTVTQTGTGNSFVVNDQAGDTTPFVINSAGLVGLNVSNPAAMLDIAHSLTSGTGIRLAVASGQSFNASAGLLYVNIQNTGATGKAFVIENRGTGDCLYIHDSAATDTTPFVVNNNGDCIIVGQTITAGSKLDVRGRVRATELQLSGSGSIISDVSVVGPNTIRITINGTSYDINALPV